MIASVGLFATGYISDSTTVQTVENMLDEDADTTDSRDDVTETDDKETTKEPVTANVSPVSSSLLTSHGNVTTASLICTV